MCSKMSYPGSRIFLELFIVIKGEKRDETRTEFQHKWSIGQEKERKRGFRNVLKRGRRVKGTGDEIKDRLKLRRSPERKGEFSE